MTVASLPASTHQSAANLQDAATKHAVDAVNVAAVGASFLKDNIHPLALAIVELSKFDDLDSGECRSRIRLLHDLAKLNRYLVEDAATCMEGERDQMNQKLDVLKGKVS